jgi:hypothetical protein
MMTAWTPTLAAVEKSSCVLANRALPLSIWDARDQVTLSRSELKVRSDLPRKRATEW